MDLVALPQHAAIVVLPVGVIYAAASDLVTFTIPNRIAIALLAAFLLLAPLAGMEAGGLAQHLVAGAGVLALCFGMFTLGWVGGGDAKIASVAALWIGWSHLLDFVAMTAIFGGLLTVGLLLLRRLALPAFAMHRAWLARLHDSGTGVPYGVAIAAGALATYPQTVWFVLVAG